MADFMETLIAESVVDAALQMGYAISVNDGEETTLRLATDRAKILNAMQTTEQDYLWFTMTDHNGPDHRAGFIWLIWGNGEDLISDCTATDEIEEIISEAARLRRER